MAEPSAETTVMAEAEVGVGEAEGEPEAEGRPPPEAIILPPSVMIVFIVGGDYITFYFILSHQMISLNQLMKYLFQFFSIFGVIVTGQQSLHCKRKIKIALILI